MMNDLDELLTRVLTPGEEASDILNRKTIEQVKETSNMRQKKYRRASAAVVAAALVAATSITAVAAWQYKSASEIADRVGDEKLADNFAEQMSSAGERNGATDIADIVGESQSFGGYKVTVLGLLSGESLSGLERLAGGNVRSDRTYCAVTIEKEDGLPIDAEHEDYFVSPLIGGLEPWLYNAASLCGNYSEFVENGVLYRLLECDNIEYFADHDLYLCVTDTSFYDSGLYDYNEADGSIARNAEYEGLNALFKLEIDSSLADPAKAQALLDDLDALQSQAGDEIEVPKEAKEAMEWADRLTPETIGEYCVRMENTVQTVTVNKDGYYVLEPWLVNEAVSDTAGGGGGTFSEDWMQRYTPGKMYIDGYSTSEKGMAHLVITTITLNEDGSLTFAAWVPKEGSAYLQ